MKTTLLTLTIIAALTTPAGAATLSVSADHTSYGLGDTVTLAITGDAEGQFSLAAFAYVQFAGSGAVTFDSASQIMMTSFGGAAPWTTQPLGGDVTGAVAINQLSHLTTGLIPDTTFAATVVLTAVLAGTVAVSFEGLTGSATQLDFFGLTSGTGTSFTIVPEPTPSILLALGLFGLGASRRLRVM